MNTEVSLVSALVGSAIDVHTLDGRLLKIPISQTITPGFVKVVEGEGMPVYNGKEMPVYNGKGKRGDLHIKFKTVFPTLTEAQKQMLKSAFTATN